MNDVTSHTSEYSTIIYTSSLANAQLNSTSMNKDITFIKFYLKMLVSVRAEDWRKVLLVHFLLQYNRYP